MRQILRLSLFYFLVGCLFSHSAWSQKKIQPMSESPSLAFLEQAEDVEREAWWIITNKREDENHSPFRVFRVAASQTAKSKKRIETSFCKKLKMEKQGPDTWHVEALCRKPSQDLGVIQKVSAHPEKWKLIWKNGPFVDQYGIGVSILYPTQECQFEVGLDGEKLRSMKCPHYVRDRNENEIAEFKVFEYRASSPKVLRLEGEIKKELQVTATFKTEVPLSGDIILKVKKIPQKPVEEKKEFSNMTPQIPTRGGVHGEKENNSQENAKEDSTKEGNNSQDSEEKKQPSIEEENQPPGPLNPEEIQHDSSEVPPIPPSR